MISLLLVLLVIACFLLVVIILAQNPKGGGLTNLGSGASQMFGARQAADLMEKLTWYFGIGIIAVIMLSYFVLPKPGAPGEDTGIRTRTEGVDFMPQGAPPTQLPTAPPQQTPPSEIE